MSRHARWLAFALFSALLFAVPLDALDRPKVRREAGLKTVPFGAIKIPLPDVQQPDEYSCGPSCLMSVCLYYGVGPRTLDEYKKELGTDAKQGTKYQNIEKYANSLGLKAEMRDKISIDDLKSKYLDQGIPVICSIQAWGGPKADYTKNGNGHYVVAIGYDTKDNFYFMDPYSNHHHAVARPRYGCLTRDEFEKRWHEDEGWDGAEDKHVGLGIIIQRKGPSVLMAREIE